MTNVDPNFTKELTHLINKYCMENHCDVPDFILAKMLTAFITNVAFFTKETLDWYGVDSVCHPNGQRKMGEKE